MGATDAAEPASWRPASSPSVDSFLEAKLHWPPLRERWVARDRLLDLLDSATKCPVTLIAAPAGYGKTILVAQWLASSRRTEAAAAWVSLDSGDNDPDRLWAHVATALERAGCLVANDLGSFVAATGGEVLTGLLPRMVNALAAMPDDIIVLLDDFHFVDNVACLDQVEFLIEHLPPQAHLVIITRADPGLRLGRLRASGGLAEVRAERLAFSADEASSLLAVENVHLGQDILSQLLDRTEGWPAGLYLAALSLSGRADADEFVRDFSGGNRFIGDYLTEEVLTRHSGRVREFIATMSILDRFTAPLCDFVAETNTSAAILSDLERSNLFLVPLDEDGQWFRFHHLFAAVARSELQLEDPKTLPVLHTRAARWFRDHGYIEEAVTHFLAAGQPGEVAELVQANWLRYVDVGRMATVSGWLRSLGEPLIASDPAAGVAAAWMSALTGDEQALEERLVALQAFGDTGPLPDGTRSVESAIALIRGFFGFGGPVEMLRAARRAVELETDGRSPHYAIAHMSLGHSAYIAGDLDLASSSLSKVWPNEAAPVMVRVLSLSTQSLVEAERGRRDRSRQFAEQAMDLVDSNGLQAMHQTALVFTALGQAQGAAGKLSDALATLEHGLALRRKNPALSPWQALHLLLVLSRVALDAGDVGLAQESLDEAAQRMNRFRDGMGPMRTRLEAIQSSMRARVANEARGTALTERELEVLRLLQGSASLSEIARQLYVSPNTVKTHVNAVYRKLGVSSRTEAVQAARQRMLA